MKDLFPTKQALVGMVHIQALPGTPNHRLSIEEIVEQAVREAQIFESVGYHGIILENMHDIPYMNREVGPEIVACMTRVCAEVRRSIQLPLGLQILAGANREALAAAQAGGANFIRAEGFIFSHIADEGLMNATAGELLRYRKMIGAEDIKVLCDIKKKHSSHAITADTSLAETAHAAEFFQADGVIVTGVSTGAQTETEDLAQVTGATSLPVWIGSGITPNNVSQYKTAHGIIVGSWVKLDGDWRKAVCPERAARMRQAFEST